MGCSREVSFSPAVSLLWKNDIEAARKSNYGYPYYHKIVINGEEDVYYPVIFKGGEQTVKRDILIRRGYSEQAPDSWNTSTHKGGLILLVKANFGVGAVSPILGTSTSFPRCTAACLPGPPVR